MKNILLIVLLVAVSNLSNAQTSFQRIYGGAGDDRGHAVIATSDGGFAIAGHTNSFGAGGDDIFILKVDVQGVIQWQKTYGRSLDEYGFGIAIMETPNSEFVVTGLTGGDGGDITDVFVFKTDLLGNLIWDYAYDTGTFQNSAEHGRGLLYTSDGYIMVFGTDDGDSFGSNDGLILKLDSDGNLIWKQVYGGTSNDHFQHGLELPGGNVLICGSSQTYGPGNSAGYLVNVNSDGEVVWANSYGGNQSDGFNAMDFSDESSIITAGTSNSFGAGGFDILLCKIDTSGNLIWSKTYGGTQADRAASVKTLVDGSGYVIVAFSDSYGNGERDILVVRTNTEGDVVWAKTFGTQGYDAVLDWAYGSLLLTESASLVMTGWSDSLSISGEDVLLVKSDLDGNAFCSTIVLEVDSPVLESIATSPGIASPGTYEAINSIVMNASMVSQELCHCIEDCEKCEMTVVHFDLNNCYSNLDDGSNMDYSEFIPKYPGELSYATISATTVYRENAAMNKHSCTPGVEHSPAMCVGSVNSCTYDPGHMQSVVFEVTIAPDPDSSVRVTSLSFYEKAPIFYNWINGASGQNNYPELFGVRVLKDDSEIFVRSDIPTSIDTWSERFFEFPSDTEFIADKPTTFRVELLAYCLIGNSSQVNAWDLDEISIAVSCDPVTGALNDISGFVLNPEGLPLQNIDILLSEDPLFQAYFTNTTTDHAGKYVFKQIPANNQFFVKGYNNSDWLQGVSTLDLIYIQKHLLGLQPLESPFQLVAADVNKSHSVSVMDVHLLRQLILGRITELPNNTSWRYLVADQELSTDSPWDCKEVIELPMVGVDVANAHFVGVKTGDVTIDTDISPFQSKIHKTSLDHVSLFLQDRYVDADSPILVEITGQGFQNISGFQCALNFSDIEFVSIESNFLNITDGNYHYEALSQQLHLSWSEAKATTVASDEVLFTLRLVARKNGKLSEMISLNSHAIAPQIYMGDALDIEDLELEVSEGDSINLFELNCHPNPFSSVTTLNFVIAQSEYVDISISDLSGKTLFSRRQLVPAGSYAVPIASSDIGIGHGIVFCRVTTESGSTSCKMIVTQ